ncbi:MAG: CBS domain-containing protein [Candidatus Aenigmarchaeota archaeon]|nr:CBS domain-containing protein [Candidatus Aenigmarchaeota archaeon]NIP39913.1 CBS domain-containing protein [Candidatus Aenigmarchaeota archaeon]NIQ17632.1 CBS domain-containing protein [Candidatus Aenigmarchaeota archaeon]NIS72820.1 CBS domain-containing protein [Candidatus Aenigmarchaeota archaeon]
MKLEDVLEDAFFVKPDDSLSHVVSMMAKEKRYEAFVSEGGFKGIITLDDIIKRRLTSPQNVKVSNFMKPINPFEVDSPVEDVINYMLVSEHRSLPIKKGGRIFAVTKPKLLNFIKDEVFEGKKAKDVMQFPYSADTNDTLSTVISVMKETGLDRIPILDEKGGFVGLVDSVSLANVLTDKGRSKRGERFGDKERLEEVGIERFLRKEILKVNPETELKRIVRDISKEGVCAVIVEGGEKFLGMITVRDLFKLIGKSLETVYIRISGLDMEDDFIKSKIDEMVDNTITKLLKSLEVNYVAIHVETHKSGGKRKKYSAQGRFVTDKGNFHASDHEWDPTKAMKLFLSKIEREVHKKVEMERGY